MGVVVDIVVVEMVGWDGMGCWEEVERFGHTGMLESFSPFGWSRRGAWGVFLFRLDVKGGFWMLG